MRFKCQVGRFLYHRPGWTPSIEELWKMFGNWKISLKSITKHFLFRALLLDSCPDIHLRFLFLFTL